MAEVTKEDINRIHGRIDETGKAVQSMAVDLAKIATVVESLPAPPKQPCEWHGQLRKEFDSHTEAHKKVVDDWRGAFIKAAVDILKIAAVAGLSLLVGMKL